MKLMNSLRRAIVLFHPFSLAKFPLGLPWYLNILHYPPALWYMIKRGPLLLLPELWPLYSMAIFSLINPLVYFSYEGLFRSFMFCAHLVAIPFYMNYWKRPHWRYFIKQAFFLATVLALLEQCFGVWAIKFIRQAPNDHIYRTSGLVGEANFSALTYNFLYFWGLSFFPRHKKWLFLITSLLHFQVLSRAGIMVFGLYHFLLLFPERLKRGVAYALIALECSVPFFFTLLEKYLPLSVQHKIEFLSSGRFRFFSIYPQMSFSYFPLGRGIGQSIHSFHKTQNEFLELKNHAIPHILEQHNLFIQILSDLGLIAYLLWCFFLLFTRQEGRQTISKQGPYLVSSFAQSLSA